MAQIDKLYKSMGLPMNIKRGNPWPLDASSLWYSYDEMKAYAEDADSVAYVGQILGLVDEENDSAEAYIIADSNGTLKPIGSGAINVDSKTIMIDSESDEIGLKDFGKRFYKYIPEAKDDEGNVILEASYELTEVSDANPWAAGLEPRVVSENGVLVLGWFEPNPTTIDGVNNQVSSLQTSVSDLQKVAEDLVAEVDKKANAADVFTKNETLEQIATAVNNIDHLQRKIVSSYADIVSFVEQEGADEAAKYIFMVPETDTTADGNIYEEYIVVNGVIEVVGKWATDLSDYVTIDNLSTTLNSYVTKNSFNQKLEEYTSTEELNQLLNNFIQEETLNNYLNEKVDKQEGYGLVSLEEIEKLSTVSANAEENFIKKVSNDFLVDTTGTLSLKTDINSLLNDFNSELQEQKNSLDALISKVAESEKTISSLNSDVEEIKLNYTNVQEAIGLLNTGLENIEQEVVSNRTLINELNTGLKDYVKIEDYNADIEEIYKHLVWTSLEN